jgi:osmotically-inducible protein OsmY
MKVLTQQTFILGAFILFVSELSISAFATDASTSSNSVATSVRDADKDNQDVVLTPEYTSYKDMRISRNIRNALVQDKQLSASAKNIDIISSAGHVSLIGPVQSKNEARRILANARHVEGIATLKSELTVPQNK